METIYIRKEKTIDRWALKNYTGKGVDDFHFYKDKQCTEHLVRLAFYHPKKYLPNRRNKYWTIDSIEYKIEWIN